MTDEIHFLKIQSYSDHPEVVRAAELLVQSMMSARKRRRNEQSYIRDAKKLIASLWCKGDSDLPLRLFTSAKPTVNKYG
jgi:hypothetical protein